eukprot:TRINITY_DN3237_c0_g1_i2.p1 TRINITY_DN3237_c0_g1~~TRINITY_DN3237_c0_g1_i2.p1  ORF type:complete len:428 (+),score=58.34 TRINITY_DN3237_c0_g1_i2:736-2019(+)
MLSTAAEEHLEEPTVQTLAVLLNMAEACRTYMPLSCRPTQEDVLSLTTENSNSGGRSPTWTQVISTATESLSPGSRRDFTRGESFGFCPIGALGLTNELDESINRVPRRNRLVSVSLSGRKSRKSMATTRNSGQSMFALPALYTVPGHTTASFLVVNRCKFLGFVEQHANVVAWMSDEILQLLHLVELHRGILDHVNADRTWASFGASRTCSTHAIAAVSCASDLRESDTESVAARAAAICTGQVLCGDFGVTGFMRFMALGRVQSAGIVAERVCTQLGAGVLVGPAVRMEVESMFHCRALTAILYPKAGYRNPAVLWQITGKRMQKPPESAEWMYELGAAAPDVWYEHNALFQRWLADGGARVRGDAADAAEAAQDPQMRGALLELAAAIRMGGAAVREVRETGLVERDNADTPAKNRQDTEPVIS